MTLLIDAAPIVALADPAEPRRAAILDPLTGETGSLVIRAPTTAEIDHLLGQRFGSAARRAFLADLAAGRFCVGNLERVEVDRDLQGPSRRDQSPRPAAARCPLTSSPCTTAADLGERQHRAGDRMPGDVAATGRKGPSRDGSRPGARMP